MKQNMLLSDLETLAKSLADSFSESLNGASEDDREQERDCLDLLRQLATLILRYVWKTDTIVHLQLMIDLDK
jgi:hypothetical protein